MSLKKFNKMSDHELQENLNQLKKDFFDLRFKLALGQLNDTSKISKIKKNIARIKTVITVNKLYKKNNNDILELDTSHKISNNDIKKIT